MAEYRLSPAAEYDLEDIWLYTYRQWSEEQANHYIDMRPLSNWQGRQ